MRGDERIAAAALFFILLFCCQAGFGDPAEPAGPSVPDVTVREGGGLFIKSEISLFGGEILKGTITAVKDTVSFRSLSDQKTAPRVERVADIAEISFLEWQGEKKQGGAYHFTPSNIKIIMKSGNEYRSPALPVFDKFSFVTEGKSTWKYASFYGYNKNGKWDNGLEVSKECRTGIPVTGTVVKIVFKPQDEDDPFRGIFRLLKK